MVVGFSQKYFCERPALKMILSPSKYAYGVPKKNWAQLEYALPGICVMIILPSKNAFRSTLSWVVDNRRGWPWPPWLFLPCLVVIWSNFCFENILGLCCYLDQDCRGPPAPNGVVDDRRGWPWSPNMFCSHLEQLLSSKHRLYLEIAVKFSSQEHGVLQGSKRKKVVLTPKSQNLG